jgi:hypothetical protein
VVFEKVVLDGTRASLRCVFQLACQLKVLHMNETNISENSFRNLHLWKKIEELRLDGCRGITGNIFSSLTSSPLKRLSIVDSGQELSLTWIQHLIRNCRNLKELYVGRNLTEKCEGLKDIATFATLQNPHLLPCGHVEEKATIDRQHCCSFCRADYVHGELIRFRPRIFRRFKEGEVWKSEPVDAKRRSLDGKVLYHTSCGELFNMATVRDIFMKEFSREVLRDETCPTCRSKFNDTLRVCYLGDIKGGALAEEGFPCLGDLGNYVSIEAVEGGEKKKG